MAYHWAVHWAATKAEMMVYVSLEPKLVATMADYLVAMMAYLMVV